MRCLVCLVALVVVGICSAQGPEPAPTLFADDFAAPELDAAQWVRTMQNDFEMEAVDIVDGRLRMAAATVGTDDRTVKFHGVRTAEPVVDLTDGVEVSFDLDWNDQANGCYMTAGAYLCPTIAENPRDEPDWLRIQYIGVPPGHNTRCLVTVKRNGHEEHPLTENWPEDRTGREIGLQHIGLALDGQALVVMENQQTLLQVDDLNLGFQTAYLYLQHSSHSNYRLREVFFDNVVVRR